MASTWLLYRVLSALGTVSYWFCGRYGCKTCHTKMLNFGAPKRAPFSGTETDDQELSRNSCGTKSCRHFLLQELVLVLGPPFGPQNRSVTSWSLHFSMGEVSPTNAITLLNAVFINRPKR